MECHACGKTGHIATACHTNSVKHEKEYSRKHKDKRTNHVLYDNQLPSETNSSSFKLKVGGRSNLDPITVTPLLNGKKLDMEMNTQKATF